MTKAAKPAKPATTRSLALDISTRSTGWSVFIDGQLVAHGFLYLEKIKTFETKCVAFYDFFIAKIEEHRIDNVCAENQFFGRNGKTGIILSRFSGIICLICGQLGLPIVFYPPTEIKRIFTGKGNATKDEVRVKVLELYQLDIADDNESDAIAIGHTHVQKQAAA